jgi:transcription elongation factor Elf1
VCGKTYEGRGGVMKIKAIKSQIRRDFTAIYQCEHCGHETEGSGYDDRNFHQNVIPKMKCKQCGMVSGDDYRPLATKYPDYAVV